MFRTEITTSPADSGPQQGTKQSKQAKKLGNGRVPPSKATGKNGGRVKTLTTKGKTSSSSARSKSSRAVEGRIAPKGSATSGNRTNKVLAKGGREVKRPSNTGTGISTTTKFKRPRGY